MGKTRYRRFDRTLKLNFYTSSVDKLLQARLLFSEHGYQLGVYRGRREPYDEDYSSTTENLLTRAIEFVSLEFGLRSPFLIEDTSIRIDALSGERDFPGLAAKEWFSETSFEALDVELSERSNNRFAVVKSDIALHLPGHGEPIFFHGETTGVVADTPPTFEENPLYPWLTPRTFNGWFVPDGQAGVPLRLGEMEYENSLNYDFRVQSLLRLLRYYDQLNAALNISPAFVDVRSRRMDGEVQLSLPIQPSRPVICVVGEKCAGKTTFANFLIKEHEAIHIEASTLFGELAAESGLPFASDAEVLGYLAQRGYEIVARRVVDRLAEHPGRLNVVTGLRTPEEINYLQSRVEDLVIVYVSAEQRIRYERHLRRKRDPAIETFKHFAERDLAQRQFGVLCFTPEVADFVVSNDGSLGEYVARISTLADEILRGAKTRSTSDVERSEQYRSVQALERLGRIATCEEISDATASEGPGRVRLYNVNRALKALPEFARRVEVPGKPLAYGPTQRTQAALHLLSRRLGRQAAAG